MRVETPRGGFEVHRFGDSGPAVLLLHPLALSGRFWDPVAEVLAEQAQVIALDARGHGGSDWDGQPFTIQDMADDTAEVLAALVGDEPASIAGMSMGGCTAVALAARQPERVNRLVLADTTSCYGPDRLEVWEERAVSVEQSARADLLPFQTTRWFSDGFLEQHPGEVQEVIDIFLKTSSAVHAAASRAMGHFDGTGSLGEVSADTLVLVGEEDYATPPAMAKILAEGIPRARLEILSHARHLSLLERPDVWPAVRDHLVRAAVTR